MSRRDSLTVKAAVAYETESLDGVNDEAEDFYAILGVVRLSLSRFRTRCKMYRPCPYEHRSLSL